MSYGRGSLITQPLVAVGAAYGVEDSEKKTDLLHTNHWGVQEGHSGRNIKDKPEGMTRNRKLRKAKREKERKGRRLKQAISWNMEVYVLKSRDLWKYSSCRDSFQSDIGVLPD